MIKLDVIKMLHTMHRAGVVIEVKPEWSREEWVNYIIHQFNLFVMSPAYETATETAELCYKHRGWRGQAREWKAPFIPGQRRY